MKILTGIVCAAFGLTALNSTAGTGPNVQSPAPSAVDGAPLRAAVEAAYTRSVQFSEASGQSRLASTAQAAARSIWPEQPSVEFAHDNGRWDDGQGARETEIGVHMPLWMPGQKAAARANARAETDYASAYERAARLRIAGEVREAAWSVTGAEAELLMLDQQTQGLKRLLDDVERRVNAGDLARADALAIRGEWLAAQTGRLNAERALHEARLRWTALTGLPPLGRWVDSSLPTTEHAHPEQELARLNTERARTRHERVRTQRGQAPELSLRYRHEVEGGNAQINHSVGLGVRVPFGGGALNRSLEAEARMEFDVAQAHETRVRARLDAEREAAQAAVRVAEEQLRLEQERASLLQERLNLFELSFKAGNTPLPDLLRAREAAMQADSSRSRQQAALGLARSRLLQTLGILP